MQKARVLKVKQSPKVLKTASPQTKKAVKFFQDKAPASDLLEDTGSKKPSFQVHTNTLNDKFFNFIDNKEVGKWLALGITTAVIVAIAYWGIRQ